MKLWAGTALLFLSVFTFNSCKNDLKLDAPYKEIPSIYAVLNPQDRIQVIRINKVFMGAGNANQMAQVADSINYPAGEITVTLSRYVNDAQVDVVPGKRTIVFRDSMVQAASGAFNSSQRVYVCSDDLHQGIKGVVSGPNTYTVFGNYLLTVKNNRTGNIFTAHSTAIDSISGNQGNQPLGPPYYPYNPTTPVSDYVDYYDYNGSILFTPDSAQLYQLVIRMHFYDSLNNHQKIFNYIDYTFQNQNAQNVTSIGYGQYISYTFRPADIFEAAGVGLSQAYLTQPPVLVGRKMYKIQFFIYSTTQDYIDYLQFISPSLSVTQDKPLYSNFDNQAALGIFTFRARCSVTKAMANTFVSQFAYDPNTCAYHFFTAALALPNTCN